MNGDKLKIQNKAKRYVGGRTVERGGRAAIEERARYPGRGPGASDVTIARPAAVFQPPARREHERRRHARRHGRLRGWRQAEARAPSAAAALRAAATAAAPRPLLRAPQVPRAQTWRKPHPLHAHQWYHRQHPPVAPALSCIAPVSRPNACSCL